MLLFIVCYSIPVAESRNDLLENTLQCRGCLSDLWGIHVVFLTGFIHNVFKQQLRNAANVNPALNLF